MPYLLECASLRSRSVVQFGQSSHIANFGRYPASEFVVRQIENLEVPERIDTLWYLTSQVVVSEVSIQGKEDSGLVFDGGRYKVVGQEDTLTWLTIACSSQTLLVFFL